MATQIRTRRQRGVVYILTVLMLVVMTSLAAALNVNSSMAYMKSENSQQLLNAQMAVESGLSFGLYLVRDFRSSPTKKPMTDVLEPLRVHITAELTGNAVKLIKADPDIEGDVDRLIVTPRRMPKDLEFQLEYTVCAWDVDESENVPTQIRMVVTGTNGSITRKLSMKLAIQVDRQLLHYGLVSSLRIVGRGQAKIHGPVCSSWGRELLPGVRNNSTFPLDIHLQGDGMIDGTIGTTLSEAEFTGDPDLGDVDFHTGIRHDDPTVDLRGKMVYDEPEVMNLTNDDFDTTPLKAKTKVENLPVPDATGVDIGAYSVTGGKWTGYDGSGARPPLENICIPKGTNARFENCTFRGITYIEVDENTGNPSSSNQNSVVFHNCTFEGPVITGVPKKMDWRYNCMQFTGNTHFNKSMIQAALGGVTLMAPNYNVNIGGGEGGGGQGDSEICGLVIGGCVDLYNNMKIKGTVVSMAQIVKDGKINVSPGGNENWLRGSSVCGANVGNLDGSDGIEITPDPNNVMPLGIKRRYVMAVLPDSYCEIE